MTAFTPRQAPASESGSLRSPKNTSVPHSRRSATFSAELVVRISALTFSPRLDSLWQISLPTKPVAPTTRIMSVLPRTEPTPVSSLECGNMRGRRVADKSKSWSSLFLHRTTTLTRFHAQTEPLPRTTKAESHRFQCRGNHPRIEAVRRSAAPASATKSCQALKPPNPAPILNNHVAY